MVKNKSQSLIRLNRSILPDCIIRLSSPFPLVICRPVMPLILIPIFDEERLIRHPLPIIQILSFLSTQMRLHSKLRRASVSVEVDMLLAGFQLQEEVVMVVLQDMLVQEEEDLAVLEVVEVDPAILVNLVDQEVEVMVVLVAITLAHPVDTAPLAVLALQMDSGPPGGFGPPNGPPGGIRRPSKWAWWIWTSRRSSRRSSRWLDTWRWRWW